MATVFIEKKDDFLLTVRFEYFPSLVVKIKSMKGKQWHPEQKYWTVPFGDKTIEELLTLKIII